MGLPRNIEQELQNIERWCDGLPGQTVGPTYFKALRMSIEDFLQQKQNNLHCNGPSGPSEDTPIEC